MNFADLALFSSWHTDYFDQDEVQVMEIPTLACLRAEIEQQPPERQASLLTRTADDQTPITLKSVHRTRAVDTTGIYGRFFRAATLDQVRAAITRVSPANAVNILAMNAPTRDGQKDARYTLATIKDILRCCLAGYKAIEAQTPSATTTTVLHTGYWGCGAFRGNRVLMVILQLLAASVVGISRVVFYTGLDKDRESYQKALDHIAAMANNRSKISTALYDLFLAGYEWQDVK